MRINEVVPFFAVKDMTKSIAFYSDNKGAGVTLCFFCDDAVAFYRDVTARGIDASEPHVGNGLWVTRVIDSDGYVLLFESPTDLVEDTKLSAVG